MKIANTESLPRCGGVSSSNRVKHATILCERIYLDGVGAIADTGAEVAVAIELITPTDSTPLAVGDVIGCGALEVLGVEPPEPEQEQITMLSSHFIIICVVAYFTMLISTTTDLTFSSKKLCISKLYNILFNPIYRRSSKWECSSYNRGNLLC